MKYLILTILVMLAAFQILYYYPGLPGEVGIHFGISGQADRFGSKNFFFAFEIGMLLILLLSFAGCEILIKYLPAKFINLPIRDRLSSERIGQTKKYISNWMFAFWFATLGFNIYVFQLAINANLDGTNKLSISHFYTSLGWYLGYTLIASVILIVKFAKKPK